MIIGALIYNYFISIPIYAKIMPLEQIIAMCTNINPLIHDTGTLVLFGFLPFNIIKAVIVSLLSYLFYTKLHRLWPKDE